MGILRGYKTFRSPSDIDSGRPSLRMWFRIAFEGDYKLFPWKGENAPSK
jgi:hypothetical protein